jgi:hypothetical protein
MAYTLQFDNFVIDDDDDDDDDSIHQWCIFLVSFEGIQVWPNSNYFVLSTHHY